MRSAPPWMKNSGRGSSELRTEIGLQSASLLPLRAQHQPGEPYERRARQPRSRAHVLDEQRAQVAEGTVEHQRLDTRLAGGAEQRDDGAHRIPEQSDACTRYAFAREGDHRLQLQHLLDAEGDRRAVAARHAAVGVDDDVEALAPQSDRDPECALPLALVPTRHDDRLRRTGLPEVPRAEVHAVCGDQLGVLVVRLELERSEGEILETSRPHRRERAVVHDVGDGDVGRQQDKDDEDRVLHRATDWNFTFWPLWPRVQPDFPRSGRARRASS